MLLAQITDLHMCRDDAPMSGQIATRPYIAAAIDAVNAHTPDLVFVTGDLTDVGTAEEYALLRAELDRLTAPLFVIPGNHDRHAELRAAFADHAYLPAEGPLNWVIEDWPVRVIGLDSVVPGQGHGHLTPETLGWLDDRLSEDTRPTLVGVHHPPFPTGIFGMDNIGCLNGSEMAAVIARHSHVERVISGHHHRPVQLRWAGTLGQIAPGIAHQVALDYADGAQPQWIMEPPAFLLHRWQDTTGLITNTAYIGDYGVPRAFGKAEV